MSARPFDVVIIGGGHTGLAFARLLEALVSQQQAPLSIAVVDAAPAPAAVAPAAAGLRVVAISPASRTILERCAAWPPLDLARVGPYHRMVIWHHEGSPGGAASISFDAATQGVAELGYIVENDLLRAALWHAPGTAVTLLAGTTPTAVELDADAARLVLDDGTQLQARLVVGADGHASWLRRTLGVGQQDHAYGQHAVVAHVASALPHAGTAWQRFLPGGPLALLPLADGRVSLVWTCPSARAGELLALSDAAFDRELTAASAAVLGELQVTTRRVAFELSAANAVQYSGLRFALIGDAAHRVHPLAGQGVNLGLRDAAVLAQVLADHLRLPAADPGDPLALRRFERTRRGENALVIEAMTLLDTVFSSGRPHLAQAAGRGMGLVDRLEPVKRLLAGFAMGRRGDVPRWVRHDSPARGPH